MRKKKFSWIFVLCAVNLIIVEVWLCKMETNSMAVGEGGGAEIECKIILDVKIVYKFNFSDLL